MDFSQPFAALTPTLDGPVLRVLARTTRPLSRREVTELVGDASEAGVRKVLQRLARHGLVVEQRIGSQYSYLANREHIVWEAVEVVVSASDRLDERIRTHVMSWKIPHRSVELFGSVATGESNVDSDVDLLVYKPALISDDEERWDAQVAELRLAVERWTGNPCDILQIDAEELVEMAANSEPFLASPRVPIAGDLMAAATPTVELANRIKGAHDPVAAVQEAARTAQRAYRPELIRTIEDYAKITDAGQARIG